ncbi:RNA polymerase subunit sigma [Psychrobacillus psychrodurans]|uniref:RNA polymerase subunit sigma n=1 Tax=Psychrobacillus psychrodurans TaxID=126157 RepID=UPI001F4EC3CF|nr:RNA polymerase subunit sigma [Psychrobacillus psychrodurans]MCK1996137.1 RNA polymerase subunit sigma [Psychrobacillus psychrodurans]
MSLKLAELQIAIPKTFDAGKVADQIQQQSAIHQSNAQAASERQLEKNRETVTKSTEASETSSQDEEKERMEQERQNRKKREQEIKETKHPFKGNFVDFSG